MFFSVKFSTNKKGEIQYVLFTMRPLLRYSSLILSCILAVIFIQNMIIAQAPISSFFYYFVLALSLLGTGYRSYFLFNPHQQTIEIGSGFLLCKVKKYSYSDWNKVHIKRYEIPNRIAEMWHSDKNIIRYSFGFAINHQVFIVEQRINESQLTVLRQGIQSALLDENYSK